MIDGKPAPCGPFDCTCSAIVKCPKGKKVSSCYCYNSNPRTKTGDDKTHLEKYYGRTPAPAYKGAFPWMLSSVLGFDAIPGEVGDDGVCDCTWVNTMLLVSCASICVPIHLSIHLCVCGNSGSFRPIRT